MTTHDEPGLQQALHDLATVPAPADLGDRALKRARRRRTGRVASVGVLTLAGLLAVPFLATSWGSGGANQPAAGPLTGAAPPPAACTHAPSVAPDVKRVDPTNWPEFVRITIAALPQRSDYEMQSGYDLCATEAGASASAYAVINLGPKREHGHLTVDLYQSADPKHVAVNCALLTAIRGEPKPPTDTLLFCADGTATTPAVYATGSDGLVTVTAAYPDRRAVVIGAHGTYTGSTFTPPVIPTEVLRAIVTSPALAALLP
jgi:hypothetical protein